MRYLPLLLALVPALASAQGPSRLPLWFIEPDVRWEPSLLRLADAACPETWPFSAMIYEDRAVTEGEEVHIRDVETCTEIRLGRERAQLGTVMDSLYVMLGESLPGADAVEVGRYRQELVESHRAWSDYADTSCGLYNSVAYHGANSWMWQDLSCGREKVVDRLSWARSVLELLNSE